MTWKLGLMSVERTVTANRIMTILVSVLGVYLLVGVLLVVFQRSMMYPVPRYVTEPKVAGGVLVRVPNGAGTVFALHIPAPRGAPTVVHFHGNAEQLADQAELGAELREAHIGFFAVEYPGYGLARREQTTELAVYTAAEAALRYLHTALGVSRQYTVLQGRSLGTGVAVEMARRGFCARLVLISPFTSMVEMAKRVAPFFPVGLLVKDRYDNQSKARGINLPVLIVHGKEDEIIPFSMGRKLSELFPKAELRVVERAQHNDLFFVGGSALVEGIAGFIRQTSN